MTGKRIETAPASPVSPEVLDGNAPLLLLCDHASNHVPDDIVLEVSPDLLDRHIAIDIGAGPLTRALAETTGASAILGTLSRLVLDLHREPDNPALIPLISDGHAIPGNRAADRDARIARFYSPYHRAIADLVRAKRPDLIVAIHSFTPRLEVGSAPDRRWEVGVLSNRDRRAAGSAIAFFEREGLITGDNEPYSGRLLNATLNRHAEAQGIPSLSIEVRNDLIRDDVGVARWRDILARMIAELRNGLASERLPAT